MKEIRPPNLALEKMRSLHKRKADFRPHRPSSGGYHAPTPPQPTPSYSAPSYAPQPVIIQMMNAKIIKHSNKSVLTPAFSFQAPASSGYGSPAADPITDYGAPEHDDGEIDLHNKESQIIIYKLITKKYYFVLNTGVLCGCVNLPARHLGGERRTG